MRRGSIFLGRRGLRDSPFIAGVDAHNDEDGLGEEQRSEGEVSTATTDDAVSTSYQLDEGWDSDEPAMQKVLATAELFETILLGLPIRQLLIKIPLVCKYWRATIDNSHKLQQALFFKPIPCEPLRLLTIKKNPITLAWTKSHMDSSEYTVLMNPFCNIFRRGEVCALQRPEASWRRMIASQPLVENGKSGIKLEQWYSWPAEEYMLTPTTVKEGVGLWKKVYFADEVGLLRQRKRSFVLKLLDGDQSRGA